MREKMIIAVDFDGTICENEYPNIGKPIPEAIEALQKLSDRGVRIIIWTCRFKPDDLLEMQSWLLEHEVTYNAINKQLVDFIKGRKIYADRYIDDRNYPMGNVRLMWKCILSDIERGEFND